MGNEQLQRSLNKSASKYSEPGDSGKRSSQFSTKRVNSQILTEPATLVDLPINVNSNEMFRMLRKVDEQDAETSEVLAGLKELEHDDNRLSFQQRSNSQIFQIKSEDSKLNLSLYLSEVKAQKSEASLKLLQLILFSKTSWKVSSSSSTSLYLLKTN